MQVTVQFFTWSLYVDYLTNRKQGACQKYDICQHFGTM